MSKILISGASVSYGVGLPGEKTNLELFVNRLAKETFGHTVEQIENISVIGAENKEILLSTIVEIAKNTYETVLIQWQNMPRLKLNFGLEMYPTEIDLFLTKELNDINLGAGQIIPDKKLKEIRNFLLRYHNYHWDILDLITYINVILTVAKSKKTKVYFINYNMPWMSHKHFDIIDWNIPTRLDKFSQDLLQSNLRDDLESKKIYQIMHDRYQNAGSIQESYWLNLYYPLINMQIDQISDADTHPGPKSQQVFFKHLASLLKNK